MTAEAFYYQEKKLRSSLGTDRLHTSKCITDQEHKVYIN